RIGHYQPLAASDRTGGKLLLEAATAGSIQYVGPAELRLARGPGRSRTSGMGWRSYLTVPAALLVVIGSRPARCDFIALRNGGEIRGELLTDPRARNAGELVSIRTLSGAVVTVEKQQVDDVVRRRMVLEEYETLRRAAADTLAAQWELAEWCRAK